VARSDLAQLADAYGVATEFWDWRGQHVDVPEPTLAAVLSALGADLADPVAALAARRRSAWSRMLPPVLVVREGDPATVDVHVRHGSVVEVWVEPEGGGARLDLRQVENLAPPEQVDGELVGEASFEVPAGLGLGYHMVRASSGDRLAEMRLVVTPRRLRLPAHVEGSAGWGLATQLYSVRSADSWGVGDLVDLADLCTWCVGEHGGDFVLVNPIHAVAPVEPMEPSPYLPTTRGFANPLYLRVERVPEYARLDWRTRWEVDRLRSRLAVEVDDVDRIERDACWRAKRQALEHLYGVDRSPGRDLSYRSFLRRQGQSLEDHARWCAIAEQHGPDWRAWPEELHDPRSAAVEGFAREHDAQVDFHRWLQWLMDEQLDEVQAGARRQGMAIGVMHDLAVGVQVSGVDAWRLQDVYAQGMTVGAPPDAYSQTGQGWSQPPWRPDRLAEAAYEPFREMIASTFAHAGGVRIDHVAGLFRLWWIPDGASPTQGTYVHYDHDALVGVLALEAHRAGAVVVGEDVGVVEPWVRSYLNDRGILGTSILWFERDYEGDGQPLPPDAWRELCLASVTTHDLPPSAGYLAGDHVYLRADLGLLTRTIAEELADSEAERDLWLTVLRDLGLLGDQPSEAEVVEALHRFLAQTPARLRCLALTDAVGERRTQNQPGSVDEYPNWRVPLADADGKQLFLEDVFTSARAARLIAAVRGG